jgi:hypothetical protein
VPTPIDNIFLDILKTYSADRLPTDAKTTALLATLAERPEDVFTDDARLAELAHVFETLAADEIPKNSISAIAVEALNALLQTAPGDRLQVLQARAEIFAEQAPQFPSKPNADPTFALKALNRLINQIDPNTLPAEQLEQPIGLIDRIKLNLEAASGRLIIPTGLAILAAAAVIGRLIHGNGKLDMTPNARTVAKLTVPATPRTAVKVVFGELSEPLLATKALQADFEKMANRVLDRLNLLPNHKQEMSQTVTKNLTQRQEAIREQYGDTLMLGIFQKEVQVLLKGLQANIHALLTQDADPTDKELARTRILQFLCGNQDVSTLRQNPFYTPHGIFWAPLEFIHQEHDTPPMPHDGEFYYYVDEFTFEDQMEVLFPSINEHIRQGKTVIHIHAADQNLSQRQARLKLGPLTVDKLHSADKFHAELPHALRSVRWQTAEHYGVPPQRVRLTPMPLIRPKDNVRAFVPRVKR